MGGGNKYAAGSSNNKQRTAFLHNPKSKKTAHILSLPNEGLCYTCHETIEWKKRYRKYKPLTVPGKCNNCHQKNVKRAYHVYCDECTLKLQVCGKCAKPKDIINDITSKEVQDKEQAQIREAVRDMTERERRTFYREIEKNQGEVEKKSTKKVKKEVNHDDDEEEEEEEGEEEDFDSEDYDDEDEEDEDEGESEKPNAPKTRAQLTVKSVTQDIEKLSKIFTDDAVGTLIKSKPSSADDDSIKNNKKNLDEEDEEDEDEEDVREVLSSEQMYLKLKEQYKNKSKTEKQSNNLANNNNEEDDDEEDEDDEDDEEDAIYEDEDEEEEEEDDEEEN
ncbi:hypothetical protein DICPUDRAFT_150772 [Dictyostelium purpureum]|uniref:Uncharacterized protein n=1 Tax=Dictyostelium purpureum TaxID=5786 RepID=F0ZH78_DICPU|nr:uncharacterized protein DICPUDRAFT_150772 [Dictyostelium purpureum]EGC36673.1 hypothetical protein DICPUDRAFT_150772 [Dictyostelium purpureum]|eukprot:XP_003286772.1 hypothetical protein DICPUDRAFT_150772 [Dictyostelium purpureum]